MNYARQTFRVGLSVAIGVACTYVVAWRCCVMAYAEQWQLLYTSAASAGAATAEEIAQVARHAPTGIEPPISGRRLSLPGYRIWLLQAESKPHMNASQWVRAGWPMLAVSGEQFRWRAPNEPREHRVYPGMLVFRDRATYMPPSIPYVPVRPIWPGFAINTVLYTAIVWLLLAAPFALRRWRRIKRGLCPKCGYNLQGMPATSDACPECGTRYSELGIR